MHACVTVVILILMHNYDTYVIIDCIDCFIKEFISVSRIIMIAHEKKEKEVYIYITKFGIEDSLLPQQV